MEKATGSEKKSESMKILREISFSDRQLDSKKWDKMFAKVDFWIMEMWHQVIFGLSYLDWDDMIECTKLSTGEKKQCQS
jgi:hypothetical protein